MLLVLIILALIVFMFMGRPATKQVQAGNYRTANFEICPDSRKMFEKMKREGVPEESLKKFITMEDRFLEYEKDCACRGINREIEAIAVDQMIRESFAGYDFTYHNKHLKQASEPNRVINPYLNCFRV